MILMHCLLTTSIRIVSSKLMETLRLFGMNDTSIGKFLPLLKVVRLTAKLSSAPVKLGGASNGTCMVLGKFYCGRCDTAGCTIVIR